MHREASGEKDEIERGQGVHKLLTGDRQGKTGIWAGSPNKLEAGKNGEVAGVDAGALLSSTATTVSESGLVRFGDQLLLLNHAL